MTHMLQHQHLLSHHHTCRTVDVKNKHGLANHHLCSTFWLPLFQGTSRQGLPQRQGL